jgi:hypothetical protein
VQLLGYSADVFAHIPDFYVARDEFPREAIVGELGEIICDYGLHDVFGVALLHRHFELKPHERLVRHYSNRLTSFMRPEEVTERDLYPYLWCISRTSQAKGLYPLEFCRYLRSDDIRRYRAHMTHIDRRKEFLAQFSRKILHEGLEQVIALSGLHARSAFDIESHQTLLELTDEANRYITLDVTSKEQVERTGNTTKTLWHFSPSKEQLDGASCASHCYGHCNSHTR